MTGPLSDLVPIFGRRLAANAHNAYLGLDHILYYGGIVYLPADVRARASFGPEAHAQAAILTCGNYIPSAGRRS